VQVDLDAVADAVLLLREQWSPQAATPRSITRAPTLRENALTSPVQACTCTLG
jgi:hypothetical protein